jgi:hypothetical protein
MSPHLPPPTLHPPAGRRATSCAPTRDSAARVRAPQRRAERTLRGAAQPPQVRAACGPPAATAAASRVESKRTGREQSLPVAEMNDHCRGGRGQRDRSWPKTLRGIGSESSTAINIRTSNGAHKAPPIHVGFLRVNARSAASGVRLRPPVPVGTVLLTGSVILHKLYRTVRLLRMLTK